MDKIIIITDFRPPKKGEKFIAFSAKKVELAENDRASAGDSRFIVGAEIEVPENARCLAWSLRDCNKAIPNQYGTVTLPRKTVKKWLWEMDYLYSDMKVVTKTHSENPPSYQDGFDWRKVEGSEIEVEE